MHKPNIINEPCKWGHIQINPCTCTLLNVIHYTKLTYCFHDLRHWHTTVTLTNQQRKWDQRQINPDRMTCTPYNRTLQFASWLWYLRNSLTYERLTLIMKEKKRSQGLINSVKEILYNRSIIIHQTLLPYSL